MGEVWSAIHTVTRRSVALKFLKQSLRDKPGLRQRFLREASTASALRHPNVVEILDVFDFEERATLRVTADTDTDVWVQRTEPNSSTATLLRCSSTPAGPRCDQVKNP
jgi:serine/threonine protein kinase